MEPFKEPLKEPEDTKAEPGLRFALHALAFATFALLSNGLRWRCIFGRRRLTLLQDDIRALINRIGFWGLVY